MTKFSVAAGIALALAAGSALAADLPSRKEAPVYVPPPPAFSWTGLYGGVNIGYGFDAGGNPDAGSFAYLPPAFPGFAGTWRNSHNLNGVTGGGQVGYNYQFSPWLVLGVETDIQAADINTQQNYAGFGSNPFGVPFSDHVPFVNSAKYVDWWGTVRGRIGLVMPSYPGLMVYGTGGFAYGQVNHTVSVADLFLNAGASQIGRGNYFNTNTGWTAGGGVEWTPMAFPAWSVKVEYLYTNLGPTYVPLVGALSGPGIPAGANWVGAHVSPTQFHSVRAGLNWHFNPFAVAAPVLAKY